MLIGTAEQVTIHFEMEFVTALALALTAATGPASMTLGIEPDSVTVPDTSEVLLRVRAPGMSAADLSLQVEAGTVEPLQRAADGSFTASWHLPRGLKPRRLAAGVVDVRGGGVVFATLAVSRRAKFQARSEPGAEVRVSLDGKEVAASTAGADGRADLSVLVPPGSTGRAAVEHTLDGRVLQNEVMQLGTGDKLRLWALRVPPQDGGAASLELFVYRDSGRPPGALDVKAVSEGRAFPVAALSQEVWRVDVQPPSQEAAQAAASVPVSATASAGSDVATYQIVVPTTRPGSGPAVWRAGIQVGYATDLANVSTASLALAAVWAPPALHGVGFALQAGLGRTTTSSSSTGPGRSGTTTTTSTYWLLPIDLGVQYGWQAWHDWAFDVGAGTGVTLGVIDTTQQSSKGGVSNPGLGTALAWTWVGWASVHYHVGPGAFVLQMRLGVDASQPLGWPEKSLHLAWMSGYRFAWGG